MASRASLKKKTTEVGKIFKVPVDTRLNRYRFNKAGNKNSKVYQFGK